MVVNLNHSSKLIKPAAQARPFRDAFIQLDPPILDAFLQRATASNDSSAGVYQACVALLSKPLPQNVPLPISAQEFFLKAFDDMIKSTNEHNLRLILTLLDGACRDLLGVLPDDRVEYIEEKAYELLKNFNAKKQERNDQHQAQILCLGLMGVLAPSCKPQSRQVLPNAATPEEVPFVPLQRPSSVKHLEQIPKLFSGSAAGATMRLSITLALGLLSTGVKEVDERMVRDLKIVSQVLAIMPSSTRQAYLNHGHDVKFVNKLIEKILRPGLHPGVQLQGLVSIGLLHEGRRLPDAVVSAYSKTVLAVRQPSTGYHTMAEAVSISLPCFAAQLEEDFVRDILCYSVQAAVQSASQVSELQWLLLLTQLLGEVAQDFPNIRRSILLTLSANNFQENLTMLLKFSPTNMAFAAGSSEPCGHHALENSRRLALGICSLLLRSALMAQVDEPGIDTNIGLQLLQKQQELATCRLPTCNHIRSEQHTAPVLSLVQQPCTPGSQSDSRGWKKRLARDLETQERHRVELIERRVSEVCRDLEARCEHVEEPLRLEQRKVQELQDEIQALRKENDDFAVQAADLENQVEDNERCMEDLEAEKVQVDKNLKQAGEENEALARKVEDLQCVLDEAKQREEKTLRSARKEQDRMRTELRALLTKEEVRCEEQAKAIDGLKATIFTVEKDLSSARKSLAQEQRTNEELNQILNSALQDMEEQKTAKLQAQAEVSDLTEKEAALINQLEHARRVLAESHKKAFGIKAEHEATVTSLAGEIALLRSNAESQLRRAKEEVISSHA